MNVIHRLNEKGITALLITHFMEEAVEADRVIVMDGGKAVLDGTPAEIFDDPDRLRELGLTVPAAVDIRERLKEKGFDIPREIITIEALARFLCEGYACMDAEGREERRDADYR